MPRTFRMLSLVTAVPFFAAACAAPDNQEDAMEDTESAQETAAPMPPAPPLPILVQFTPLNESGILGDVEVSANGESSNVRVTLRSSQPEVTHQGHIHMGTCEEPGSVMAPLNAITTDAAGTGTTTSTVALPVATVANGQHIVLYHQAGGEPGTPVVCAAIPSQ